MLKEYNPVLLLIIVALFFLFRDFRMRDLCLV